MFLVHLIHDRIPIHCSLVSVQKRMIKLPLVRTDYILQH